jgi:hypothetical protein
MQGIVVFGQHISDDFAEFNLSSVGLFQSTSYRLLDGLIECLNRPLSLRPANTTLAMLNIFTLKKLGEAFLEFTAIIRHQLFGSSTEAKFGTLKSLHQALLNYLCGLLLKGEDIGEL